MTPRRSSKKAQSQPTAAETFNQPETDDVFPIVGIGASAGGLEAYTQLLNHLPDDTGMAFVLVQHLAPDQESLLSVILSRATSMPVMEVKEGCSASLNLDRGEGVN